MIVKLKKVLHSCIVAFARKPPNQKFVRGGTENVKHIAR
jgi:hypothetical protein